jgi:hypothetical protein
MMTLSWDRGQGTMGDLFEHLFRGDTHPFGGGGVRGNSRYTKDESQGLTPACSEPSIGKCRPDPFKKSFHPGTRGK